MNRDIQEQFLDYLEGSLSERERAEVESHLANDEALRKDFEAYKKVMMLEQSIAEEEHPLGPQFSVKVMDRLEEEGFGIIQRLFMSWNEHKRIFRSSLALAVTAIVVLVLARKVPEENYGLSARSSSVGADTSQEADSSRAPAAKAAKETIAPLKDPKSKPIMATNAPTSESVAAPEEEAITQQDMTEKKADSNVVGRLDDVRKALDSSEKSKDKVAPQAKVDAAPKLEEGRFATRFSSSEPAPASGAAGGYAVPAPAALEKQNRGPNQKFRGVDLEVNEQSSGASNSVLADDVGGNFMQAKPQKGSNSGSNAGDSRREAPLERQRRSQDRVVQNRPVRTFPGGKPASVVDAYDAEMDGVSAVPEKSGMIMPPIPEPQPAPRYPVVPPPADEVDNYKTYEEQPRIRTTDEALSTFSVDVDTASYTNARSFLMAGNFPPQQSIRIEEFINYFDFKYPTQTEKPFSLTYEIAPSPLEKDRLFLRLGIKAREAKSENKPWNLVFLIDTSGSMSPPERLELIKKGLHVLVSKMRPEDKVSIVTYAGSAGLALDATSAKESAKILAAIDALGSGGSTNGAGGIELAYQVAERNKISNGVNRVILATDGDFNVGITSESQLNSFIEEKRKSGITLTTLGVGTSNFKDARLEQLADKGNGNYFYLDSFQEARHVLGDKIAGTVEVVAKDVKLQIEFNPQHVAQYRLIGYDNRKLNKEDFNNDAIDAGEIGVGHTVTAIYELVLTNTELARRLNTEYRYKQAAANPSGTPTGAIAEEMAAELGFLKIRFKEPEGSVSSLLEFPIESSKVQTSVETASADFRFASAVAYFGTLLRGSKFAGNYSYHDIADLAEKALGEDPSGQRREFLNMVKNADARSK